MRVSILGAGAVAYGAAAYLAETGHDPILWSPSGKRTAELAAGRPLIATGAITSSFMPHIASTCADALANADVVMVALPAYGHKLVLEAAAPHVREGQPIIISSHMSFGALYLSKLLITRGIRAPIIVWGTTLSTGRQLSSTEVKVGTVRQKVDMATLPGSAIDEGHAVCSQLFGDRFERRDGLLAIELSNLNPQGHLGIALLNLTRMERGEEWSQNGNITPTVGRLIEALDQERLDIAKILDLPVKTIREHLSQSNRVPINSVFEMSQEMYRQGLGGPGPKTVDSRYVLEDVPYGLVPTVLLGRLTGSKVTLHESGIAIFSAAYGRDFTRGNDILPELDLEHMSVAELRRLTCNGYEPA